MHQHAGAGHGAATQGLGLQQQRGVHWHERHIHDNQVAGQAAVQRVAVRLLEAHGSRVDDDIEALGRERLDTAAPPGAQIFGQGGTAFETAVEHRDLARRLQATVDHCTSSAAGTDHGDTLVAQLGDFLQGAHRAQVVGVIAGQYPVDVVDGVDAATAATGSSTPKQTKV
ncbi:hypothetical protein D3C76_1189500 [compost metagenome]